MAIHISVAHPEGQLTHPPLMDRYEICAVKAAAQVAGNIWQPCSTMFIAKLKCNMVQLNDATRNSQSSCWSPLVSWCLLCFVMGYTYAAPLKARNSGGRSGRGRRGRGWHDPEAIRKHVKKCEHLESLTCLDEFMGDAMAAIAAMRSGEAPNLRWHPFVSD